MTKALPPRPHLDWLKKTAKDQLAQMRVRKRDTRLHEAQLAVAKLYGFKSWRALKAHVDARSTDGLIVAATIDGRATDLDKLLAAHPEKIALVGGQWRIPLLHLAAANGRLECINVLLRRGFDVRTRDRLDNATALHWAAGHGHLAIVKRLLKAGADIDGVGDAHEVGVIGWATCFRELFSDVGEYLLAQGAKPTLFSAVALNRGDLVRALAKDNPSTLKLHKMSRFEHHRTPLHLAVLKNRPEMVALLLKLGADAVERDSRGYTPLNYVTAKTDKAIAAQLIAAGATPKDAQINRFEKLVPILNVKDVTAAIDYYVDKLGFEKKWDWGDPPGFGCVGREEIEIFLCRDAQGGPGMWLSIFVHDVDALYETYKRTGAIIKQKPTNFPWGLREMNVQDLDGHRIRMGSEATGPSDGIDLAEER